MDQGGCRHVAVNNLEPNRRYASALKILIITWPSWQRVAGGKNAAPTIPSRALGAGASFSLSIGLARTVEAAAKHP
jgi:hypothetical protein